MNPLTLVKRIQKINSREAALGISDEASWHAKYKDSAYAFVSSIPFDLTEGDLLAVFAQYGEIVDVNLVRDKGTGKSKGFAFIAYEDQRSTNLAVDHVSNYKKKEEEDEEEEQRKRAERGVCHAFQRGECTRGARCKFSHDEQRAANTGWGAKDDDGQWGHDKFDGPERAHKRSSGLSHNGLPESRTRDGHKSQSMDSSFTAKEREADHQGEEHRKSRRHDPDDFEQKSRGKFDRREDKNFRRDGNNDNVERGMKDRDRKEERIKRYDDDHEPRRREDYDRREEKRSRRHDDDDTKPRSRGSYERKEESRSKKHESDSRSTYDRKPSSRHRKER
ncbi:hypothetical protein EUGRSUZ_L03188 [Eucalyptus grandis]|uniref:RRM domain-containing protein n=1 Tax=Eucalyptus grandis TaxID=71139 RepID=A0AAD9WIE2_EUCGR|nr:hypothetical protein EUGRSUZ_L03188 [Eucalyptus grandis]